MAISLVCKASVELALPGVDSFISSSISGVVARKAPFKFGLGVKPSNGLYLPGDEISVTFDEPVCVTFTQIKFSVLPENQSADQL